MDFALVIGALMLGAAGAPHCAAMCGAASGALLRGCGVHSSGGSRRAPRLPVHLSFHLARIAGYAAAGAVAASSVGALAQLGHIAPVLRPLWTLLHCAALALGLWLLWRGRQPAWLENLGRGTRQFAPQQADVGGWQRMQGPARASAAGLLWVAWPCGLLQSALVMAALANTAVGGAIAMGVFAAASAAGLGLVPWVFARLSGGQAALQASVWAVRLAGAMLAGASAWALGHDLFHRVVAYCLS